MIIRPPDKCCKVATALATMRIAIGENNCVGMKHNALCDRREPSQRSNRIPRLVPASHLWVSYCPILERHAQIERQGVICYPYSIKTGSLYRKGRRRELGRGYRTVHAWLGHCDGPMQSFRRSFQIYLSRGTLAI